MPMGREHTGRGRFAFVPIDVVKDNIHIREVHGMRDLLEQTAKGLGVGRVNIESIRCACKPVLLRALGIPRTHGADVIIGSKGRDVLDGLVANCTHGISGEQKCNIGIANPQLRQKTIYISLGFLEFDIFQIIGYLLIDSHNSTSKSFTGSYQIP
jgi:hypothetical protein